jgi:hypothetical protein
MVINDVIFTGSLVNGVSGLQLSTSSSSSNSSAASPAHSSNVWQPQVKTPKINGKLFFFFFLRR